MFGFFKKNKAPTPSIELSDDALDLIHGGRPPSINDEAPDSTPLVRSFGCGDAAVALMGKATCSPRR